jgi:hypothetical protein
MKYYLNYDNFIKETVQIGTSYWGSNILSALFKFTFSLKISESKIKDIANEYNQYLYDNYAHFLTKKETSNVKIANNTKDESDATDSSTEEISNTEPIEKKELSQEILDLIEKIKNERNNVDWSYIIDKRKNYENFKRLTSNITKQLEQFYILEANIKPLIEKTKKIIDNLYKEIKSIEDKEDNQEFDQLEPGYIDKLESSKILLDKHRQELIAAESFLKAENQYFKKANKQHEAYSFTTDNGYYDDISQSIKRSDWTNDKKIKITKELNPFKLKEYVHKVEAILDSFEDDRTIQKKLKSRWEQYLLEIKKNWYFIYNVDELENSRHNHENEYHEKKDKQINIVLKNDLILDELYSTTKSSLLNSSGTNKKLYNDNISKYNYFIFSYTNSNVETIYILMMKVFIDDKPLFKLLNYIDINNNSFRLGKSLKNITFLEFDKKKLELLLDTDSMPIIIIRKNVLISFKDITLFKLTLKSFIVKPILDSDYRKLSNITYNNKVSHKNKSNIASELDKLNENLNVNTILSKIENLSKVVISATPTVNGKKDFNSKETIQAKDKIYKQFETDVELKSIPSIFKKYLKALINQDADVNNIKSEILTLKPQLDKIEDFEKS